MAVQVRKTCQRHASLRNMHNSRKNTEMTCAKLTRKRKQKKKTARTIDFHATDHQSSLYADPVSCPETASSARVPQNPTQGQNIRAERMTSFTSKDLANAKHTEHESKNDGALTRECCLYVQTAGLSLCWVHHKTTRRRPWEWDDVSRRHLTGASQSETESGTSNWP